MENQITWKDLRIPTLDGVVIAAQLYQKVEHPSRVVIINSATAVLQGIYTKFADSLSKESVAVITYDYRGIGKSKYRSLKEETAPMSEWALKDAQAVFDYALQNYPQSAISMLGHSFGGQCIGLLNGVEKIDRILLVGAQVGYWRNFPMKSWPYLLSVWYILFPLLIKIKGYFPAKSLNMGEDLPRNVAWQWRKWCLTPNYLFNEVGSSLPDNFAKVHARGVVFFISDDTLAPEKSIRKLIPQYKNIHFTEYRLTPEQFGVPFIGHFGVFKSQFSNSIWPLMKKALM